MRISLIRNMRGKTVDDVAQEVRMPVYLIRKYERNERIQPIDTADLNEYYGIDVPDEPYYNYPLRAARKRLKMNGDEWAFQLNSNRERISRIENGNLGAVPEAYTAREKGYITQFECAKIVSRYLTRMEHVDDSIRRAIEREAVNEKNNT